MLKGFDMELLNKLFPSYLNASKELKGKLIDEYVNLTQVKRNTAIKRFERHKTISGKKEYTKKPGRPKKYGSLEKELIKSLFYISGFICAERLHPVISLFLAQLIDNDLNFSAKYPDYVVDKVLNISLGSLKKIILTLDKPKKKRVCLSNSAIYKNIPVITDSYHRYKYDITASGCDFVEHKGENSSGPYIITYTNVNYYSQWISRISALGKDSMAVKDINIKLNNTNPLYRFNIIKKSHQDNEKALLSYLYYNTNLELSRSRSYHSNDNCIVEQKNGDKVRNIVGYFRYETEYELNLLNKIWEVSDLIDNFFIPSHKLSSKIRDDKGRIIKKIYDKPKTPYQRLIESKDIPQELKSYLTRTFNSLNLIELKKKQRELINELFELKQNKNVLSKRVKVEVYA